MKVLVTNRPPATHVPAWVECSDKVLAIHVVLQDGASGYIPIRKVETFGGFRWEANFNDLTVTT